MRYTRLWTRPSRVLRASDCQWQNCILRHSVIWGRHRKQWWIKYCIQKKHKKILFLLLDNRLKAFSFRLKGKNYRDPFRLSSWYSKIKLFIKKLLVPLAVLKMSVSSVVQFSWSFLIQELDQTCFSFFSRGSLYQNTSTDERGGHRTFCATWRCYKQDGPVGFKNELWSLDE